MGALSRLLLALTLLSVIALSVGIAHAGFIMSNRSGTVGGGSCSNSFIFSQGCNSQYLAIGGLF